MNICCWKVVQQKCFQIVLFKWKEAFESFPPKYSVLSPAEAVSDICCETALNMEANQHKPKKSSQGNFCLCVKKQVLTDLQVKKKSKPNFMSFADQRNQISNNVELNLFEQQTKPNCEAVDQNSDDFKWKNRLEIQIS